MMMDFALILDDNNRPQMTLDTADELLNAVLLSLHIKRGAFFLNPNFGSRLHEIKTISGQDVALAKRYVEESLKWMIAAKKVDSINVTVTPIRGGRMDIRITLDTKTYEIPWGDNIEETPQPPATKETTAEAITWVAAAAIGIVEMTVPPAIIPEEPIDTMRGRLNVRGVTDDGEDRMRGRLNVRGVTDDGEDRMRGRLNIRGVTDDGEDRMRGRLNVRGVMYDPNTTEVWYSAARVGVGVVAMVKIVMAVVVDTVDNIQI